MNKDLRDKMLDVAQWGAPIHYRQSRPYANIPPLSHRHPDCSGWFVVMRLEFLAWYYQRGGQG